MSIKKKGDTQAEGDLRIAPTSRNPRCRWRETYTISGCSGHLDRNGYLIFPTTTLITFHFGKFYKILEKILASCISSINFNDFVGL